MTYRALDLFCGAGGVSVGLQRAGFEVTGVDIAAQPHYRGGTFVQADALTYPLEGFDFVWASPPCQAHTSLRHLQPGKVYPELIPATRARLEAVGISWCIENVPGAPLGASGCLIMLCGTMFGLQTPDGRAQIRRHRLFETSFSIALWPACQHGRRAITVTGPHGPGGVSHARRTATTETFLAADARAAMGIDWMPLKALSQAIPPAYAEWIGRQAIRFLDSQTPAG